MLENFTIVMASSPSDTKAKNCKFAASQVAKANYPQEDGYCPSLVRPSDFKSSGLVTRLVAPSDFLPSGLVTRLVRPADFKLSGEERRDVLKRVEKMPGGGQETREELEKPKS